jgi:hypothetical protein
LIVHSAELITQLVHPLSQSDVRIVAVVAVVWVEQLATLHGWVVQ